MSTEWPKEATAGTEDKLNTPKDTAVVRAVIPIVKQTDVPVGSDRVQEIE